MSGFPSFIAHIKLLSGSNIVLKELNITSGGTQTNVVSIAGNTMTLTPSSSVSSGYYNSTQGAIPNGNAPVTYNFNIPFTMNNGTKGTANIDIKYGNAYPGTSPQGNYETRINPLNFYLKSVTVNGVSGTVTFNVSSGTMVLDKGYVDNNSQGPSNLSMTAGQIPYFSLLLQ